MKNCNTVLHQAVATKAMMGKLKELASGKKGPQAQDKALDLVR